MYVTLAGDVQESALARARPRDPLVGGFLEDDR